jgi:hypothetical protein
MTTTASDSGSRLTKAFVFCGTLNVAAIFRGGHYPGAHATRLQYQGECN